MNETVPNLRDLGGIPVSGQSLVVLDRPTLQQPEAYIGGAAQLFASDGNIANESTQRFLAQYVAAFGAWVSRFVPA